MNTKSKKTISDLHFTAHLCDYCGCCVAVCPVDCIELEETSLAIDRN
ncbi:4Fe-4S binding protein, partial [bacterium]|nr:4Fe-4S binding protein [bacterium]